MNILKLLFLSVVLFSTPIIAQNYDIVIKGGHIIDPLNNIDQVMDLAIKGGKIANIKKVFIKKKDYDITKYVKEMNFSYKHIIEKETIRYMLLRGLSLKKR